ncbi:MAG: mechanosensitive ion channel family protein [Pseudomonadales bacterium]
MRQSRGAGRRPGRKPGLAGGSAAARRQAAARRVRGRRPTAGAGGYQGAARHKLRRFRQGSMLAVALTAWLLLMLGAPGEAQGNAANAAPDMQRAAEEAASTVRDLSVGFMSVLPKLLVALVILVLAALISAVVRPVLRRALGSWAKADAIGALSSIVIWVLAISAALSVIVGDPRTLLGSVGLIGLALSWALQTPIESFTAWLMNSFRGYYRVGDRIGVGDVFGDVYRIDFLTTTIWEAGGPDKPVQGAQPTGAMVTFPNAEVLRATVVNYTREFPWVWDEVVVPLSSETDLDHAAQVLVEVAKQTVGEHMAQPAHAYRQLLGASRLDLEICDEPQVFFSQGDSWTDATIRYLVHARRRRMVASELLMAVSRRLSNSEDEGRLTPAYPISRIALVDPSEFPGA